ncbi:beta-galactosidase [Reichenbachiella sp. MALMAid0571]|uniref:beta-galactosidase n=1 Tax=Reichenbachiella sp. MALMAid0571 TaxID=3143939 RepID=UPI0032DF077D
MKWILCLFTVVLIVNNQSIAQVEMPETIVYGTVYNIFHDRFDTNEAFYKAVDKDMKNIKDANFNLVMPFPFGQWDTSIKQQSWERTDYLVDQLEKNQLMLMPIMLKSTHRAFLPTWKWLEMEDAVREFPEVSRVSEDVKYMHPQVLESIENYFESIANRYGNRTSLVGYNLWNEAHYNSIDEITIPKFQVWLKEKYGSLQELNRVWAEDYSEWVQITPLMSRNWESSMAAIDWDLFRFANNGDIAKWAYQTIRKYDKTNFVTINTVGTVVNNPEYSQWTVDGRQIAPYTDIFGISFYPDKDMNRNKVAMPYWKYSCMYDVTRCDAGDKPYYLVEAQTNHQNGMGLFQYMSYADIHLLSWMAFADDCKGIVFWKWKPFYRGQQAFGRGLTLANGDLAPRGQAAKDVGAVLKKHGKLIFDAKIKQAEAGIFYDIVALQKSMEGINRPTGKGTTGFFVHDSFEGTYKALFDHNISTDIIRTDMPLNLEELKKYKILFLPYQLVIRQEIAEILKQYVSQGGYVVADARSAIMDQFDFGFETNPGYGLDEVFAVRRQDQYGKDGTFEFSISDPQAISNNMEKGYKAKGLYFKEQLEILDGGRVVSRFEDGQPAIVVNSFGKGTAVLCATPLGGSYFQGIESTGAIIAGLAEKAGVTPTAEMSKDDSGVMVKLHEKANGEKLVYLNNISEQDYEGKVSVATGKGKVLEVMEITSEQKVSFSKEKNNLIVDLEIPARQAKVLWVK